MGEKEKEGRKGRRSGRFQLQLLPLRLRSWDAGWEKSVDRAAGFSLSLSHRLHLAGISLAYYRYYSRGSLHAPFATGRGMNDEGRTNVDGVRWNRYGAGMCVPVKPTVGQHAPRYRYTVRGAAGQRVGQTASWLALLTFTRTVDTAFWHDRSERTVISGDLMGMSWGNFLIRWLISCVLLKVQ